MDPGWAFPKLNWLCSFRVEQEPTERTENGQSEQPFRLALDNHWRVRNLNIEELRVYSVISVFSVASCAITEYLRLAASLLRAGGAIK